MTNNPQLPIYYIFIIYFPFCFALTLSFFSNNFFIVHSSKNYHIHLNIFISRCAMDMIILMNKTYTNKNKYGNGKYIHLFFVFLRRKKRITTQLLTRTTHISWFVVGFFIRFFLFSAFKRNKIKEEKKNLKKIIVVCLKLQWRVSLIIVVCFSFASCTFFVVDLFVCFFSSLFTYLSKCYERNKFSTDFSHSCCCLFICLFLVIYIFNM